MKLWQFMLLEEHLVNSKRKKVSLWRVVRNCLVAVVVVFLLLLAAGLIGAISAQFR